jgi:hypothetical protein
MNQRILPAFVKQLTLLPSEWAGKECSDLARPFFFGSPRRGLTALPTRDDA